MDEDITIIDSNTRKEKIKNFLIKNKKAISYTLFLIIFLFIIFFGYQSYKDSQFIKISDEYNSAVIGYSKENEIKTRDILIDIINKKNSTYSPLSLYFILDNQLINDRNQINNLFEILINKTSLDKEIRNLIIYKKGLYNADQISENELLNILNPIIKNKSVWNSHALYLLAEYFYSKNQKQKSKEFFNQIINLKNSNPDIVVEAQKRLNRDLSD